MMGKRRLEKVRRALAWNGEMRGGVYMKIKLISDEFSLGTERL
jgi:hypothetical protein